MELQQYPPIPEPRSRYWPRIVEQLTCTELLPEVNWWPGKLRYYESPLSFAANFCSLNCINLKEFQKFFGYNVGQEWRLTREDLWRIAFLLNEDINVVESVFYTSVHLGYRDAYHVRGKKGNSDSVHYCPRCADLGYHSLLHELPWLKRCPFHLRSLDIASCTGVNDTIASRRVNSIKNLMLSRCRTWPRCEQIDPFISNARENVYLRLLSAWTRNSSDAAEEFSRGEFWDSDLYDRIEERTYKHLIGRLQKLEPMPELIEPLFVTKGEKCHLETRHFPINVRDEIIRLRPNISFWMIFAFYKDVAIRSDQPPPYIGKLRAVQDQLKRRHGECCCSWRREKAGWDYHWLRTDPGRLSNGRLLCPYEVALEELELKWGNKYDVLSNRKAHEEIYFFFQQSKAMCDADLIEYTPEANVNAEGYLYTYPQVWTCYEWKKTSPLRDLLNATAEFEIDSAQFKINRWLDMIEKNRVHPSTRDEPGKCVRLRETDDGLLLIKWTHADWGEK